MKSEYLDLSAINTYAPITSEDIGVYFKREDYAGFGRRFVAGIIDILIIFIFSTICLLFIKALNEEIALESTLFFLTSTAFIYLTFLKRSDMRTIGYRITGIKIVDINGLRPSLYSMFMRVIYLIFGRYDYSVSIKLAKNDLCKQTIRDKSLGHYVVMAKAKPEGPGRIIKDVKRYGKKQLFRYKKVKRDSIIIPFIEGINQSSGSKIVRG